jgi:hypothetical protein
MASSGTLATTASSVPEARAIVGRKSVTNINQVRIPMGDHSNAVLGSNID